MKEFEVFHNPIDAFTERWIINMNIIYISALEGGQYSGPLYSVPKQISAQSNLDNVYWINLTQINTEPIEEKQFYHYMSPFEISLNKLPQRISTADLVVFEEFFKLEYCLIARRLEKTKIPYIIIPRCQMTKQYLMNKRLKKLAASILLFHHFANNSKAVHFLTEQEKQDSKQFYEKKSFVELNGIKIPQELSTPGKNEYKTGVFIGRYSIEQKGLDILIPAIKKNYKELHDSKIRFVLYGPNERTGNKKKVEKLVKEYELFELVTVNGSIFGDEKKKVLQEADFFVHTSRFEGMPMSVLEALSYGLPCFLTQGSNMREIIDTANAGWGSDTDIESVSSALKLMIKTIDELPIRGNNARSVAKQFSWDKIAENCHKYYGEVLK